MSARVLDRALSFICAHQSTEKDKSESLHDDKGSALLFSFVHSVDDQKSANILLHLGASDECYCQSDYTSRFHGFRGMTFLLTWKPLKEAPA